MASIFGIWGLSNNLKKNLEKCLRQIYLIQMGFGTCAFYLNSLLTPPKTHFKNNVDDQREYFHRMTTISFAMTTIFGFTGFASIWFNSLIVHWV